MRLLRKRGADFSNRDLDQFTPFLGILCFATCLPSPVMVPGSPPHPPPSTFTAACYNGQLEVLVDLKEWGDVDIHVEPRDEA